MIEPNEAVISLGIALSVVFISVLINIIDMGLDYILYKTKRTTLPRFRRLEFFALSWTVVAILYYIRHRAIHFDTHFLPLLYYTKLILVFIILIIWAVNIKYFSGKINMKLYTLAGICIFFFLIEEIISYFTHNFYLELLKGITLLLPTIFGFFIIIKSGIKAKR